MWSCMGCHVESMAPQMGLVWIGFAVQLLLVFYFYYYYHKFSSRIKPACKVMPSLSMFSFIYFFNRYGPTVLNSRIVSSCVTRCPNSPTEVWIPELEGSARCGRGVGSRASSCPTASLEGRPLFNALPLVGVNLWPRGGQALHLSSGSRSGAGRFSWPGFSRMEKTESSKKNESHFFKKGINYTDTPL